MKEMVSWNIYIYNTLYLVKNIAQKWIGDQKTTEGRKG